MNNCTCKHDRLLHDSWGCKQCKGGCGISIIYLSNLFATDLDRAKQKFDLELAKALDAAQDRKEESDLALLHQRARDESEAVA